MRGNGRVGGMGLLDVSAGPKGVSDSQRDVRNERGSRHW